MSGRDSRRPEARDGDGAPAVAWSIDRAGRIEAVGEGWARFAEANGGAGLLPPEILGRGLSDYLGGMEVPEWEEIDAAPEPGSCLEPDEVLGRLPILDPPVPRITHEICPTCRVAILEEDSHVA